MQRQAKRRRKRPPAAHSIRDTRVSRVLSRKRWYVGGETKGPAAIREETAAPRWEHTLNVANRPNDRQAGRQAATGTERGQSPLTRVLASRGNVLRRSAAAMSSLHRPGGPPYTVAGDDCSRPAAAATPATRRLCSSGSQPPRAACRTRNRESFDVDGDLSKGTDELKREKESEEGRVTTNSIINP